MADELDTVQYGKIADLPGLGPTKVSWLSEAGITTIDDLKRVALDELAHVRGIGYVLAVQVKTLTDMEGSAFNESQDSWREHIADLQVTTHLAIDRLLGDPDRYALKRRTRDQLLKVRTTIRQVRINEPSDEERIRRNILKHSRGLCALVESATELDLSSKNFQKTLRERIKTRRKKLAKWV
jgi:hypothetical protein